MPMNLHLPSNGIDFLQVPSTVLNKKNLLDWVYIYLCEATTKSGIILYQNIFVIAPKSQQFSDAVLDHNIIPLTSWIHSRGQAALEQYLC